MSSVVFVVTFLLYFYTALYVVNYISSYPIKKRSISLFRKKLEKTNFISRSYYQMWYELAAQITDINCSISISRYGDGEYSIMTGSKVEGIDHFSYKGGDCKIRSELFKSLKCQENTKCYYGVYYNYLENFLQWSNNSPKYFTTSNIFVNKNYPKTKLLIESLINDEYGNIILFCNEEARNTSFAKTVFFFPKHIISYYEINYNEIIRKIKSIARRYINHLFMLSIGPLAPVLIWHMRRVNVNNRYIDFGSTLDLLIKGKTNRNYVNINSSNANLIDKKWGISKNNKIYFF